MDQRRTVELRHMRQESPVDWDVGSDIGGEDDENSVTEGVEFAMYLDLEYEKHSSFGKVGEMSKEHCYTCGKTGHPDDSCTSYAEDSQSRRTLLEEEKDDMVNNESIVQPAENVMLDETAAALADEKKEV